MKKKTTDNKSGASSNIVPSFKAYKKKYFPKRYAEEESPRVRPRSKVQTLGLK
jgi:hypothetical protein